jgi:hypothetical protein
VPKPESELIVLTEAETEAIMTTALASRGLTLKMVPDFIKTQAKDGLKSLLQGLQLMGWTIERPKT